MSTRDQERCLHSSLSIPYVVVACYVVFKQIVVFPSVQRYIYLIPFSVQNIHKNHLVFLLLPSNIVCSQVSVFRGELYITPSQYTVPVHSEFWELSVNWLNNFTLTNNYYKPYNQRAARLFSLCSQFFLWWMYAKLCSTEKLAGRVN